jgi:hypothetical protein
MFFLTTLVAYKIFGHIFYIQYANFFKYIQFNSSYAFMSLCVYEFMRLCVYEFMRLCVYVFWLSIHV